MGKISELHAGDLAEQKGLAVVEIYKPDCVPCAQLEPVLDSLSKHYGGRISFYQSHFATGGLGSAFGIPQEAMQTAPQILLLRDGKLVEQFTGAKYVKGVGSERVAASSDYLTKRIDGFLAKYFSGASSDTTIPRSETKNKSVQRLEDIKTDLPLSPNSLVTMAERYLLKDETGRIIERPEDMFRRVANNIAQADRNYGATPEQIEATSRDFYDFMIGLYFLPNSPTLMNAGRDLQQLSACFVLPIGDSMEEIFGAAMKGALVHKSGGGTGYSFSKLRPAKSIVRSTNGVASGPVSFMNVFNMYTEVVKQGGTRRGANMGTLRSDHPNIRTFIHIKGELSGANKAIYDELKEKFQLEDDDPLLESLKRKLLEKTQLHNFNISVGATDEFMKSAIEGKDYNLIDPRTKQIVETTSARDLLEEIVDQAWKTGDPGILFLGRINEYNPTPNVGEMEATNPCGEQPLLPYESCNLGSINLTKFIRQNDGRHEIDFDGLRKVVHTSVHFLDNVIDMNKYPLPEIEQMTKSNRKIGLGVMGFADMASMLGVEYGSDECLGLAEKVMKFVQDEARNASVELANIRGVFANWEGSIYDSKSPFFKGKESRQRNATLTTIAPTGTISMMADCESGIEPSFTLAYTKTVMDGKVLSYRSRGLEFVLKENGYDVEGIFSELEQGKRDKFNQLPEDIKKLARTSMELSSEKHIKVQAAFQKYICNAVSKTINLPTSATREDIKQAYLLAYNLGCKGITVYRDNCKDVQVLDVKGGEKVSQPTAQDFLLRRINFGLSEEELEKLYGTPLPKERLAIVRPEKVGDGKTIFVTTSYFESPQAQAVVKKLRETGVPTEFFVASNFFDPSTQALLTALLIRSSKDLREGIPLEEIVGGLKHLPPSDEIGYDSGFGPGREYANRSIPDAMWKAISGWEPPVSKSSTPVEVLEDIKEAERLLKKHKEEKKKNEVPKPEQAMQNQGFGFCSNCSKYGVMRKDGCDKCVFCEHSVKGCNSS